MVSLVSSPTAQSKTVLVLWSQPATQAHASKVVNYINTKFSSYNINVRLAHDANSTDYPTKSKLSINNSDFYFFVVHPEYGPKNGQNSEVEYNILRELIGINKKDKESLRYITTELYEKTTTTATLADELLQKELFYLENLLSGIYDDKIRLWLGITFYNQQPLEFPDHDYVMQSPKIAALIWTLQFEKIQPITNGDEYTRIDRDQLIRQAIGQMAILKEIHSIHSKCGPTIKKLLDTAKPPNGQILPKQPQNIEEIRKNMTQVWNTLSDESIKDYFRNFLIIGLVCFLESIERRSNNSRYNEHINKIVHILNSISLHTEIPSLVIQLSILNNLKDVLSMHGIKGLLASEQFIKSIKDGSKSPDNDSYNFWDNVLLHSAEFYIAFFDFLMIIIVFFGVIKIDQSGFDEDEKKNFLENEAIYNKIYDIQKEPSAIADNLVKRTNVLIIDYITALKDLLQESNA